MTINYKQEWFQILNSYTIFIGILQLCETLDSMFHILLPFWLMENGFYIFFGISIAVLVISCWNSNKYTTWIFGFLFNHFESKYSQDTKIRISQLYKRGKDIIIHLLNQQKNPKVSKNVHYFTIQTLARNYVEDFGSPPMFAHHEMSLSFPFSIMILIFMCMYHSELNAGIYAVLTVSFGLSLICICMQVFNALALQYNIHYWILWIRVICVILDIIGVYTVIFWIFVDYRFIISNWFVWIKCLGITLPLMTCLVILCISTSEIPYRFNHLIISVIMVVAVIISTLVFTVSINFGWIGLFINRITNDRISFWSKNYKFWRRLIYWLVKNDDSICVNKNNEKFIKLYVTNKTFMDRNLFMDESLFRWYEKHKNNMPDMNDVNVFSQNCMRLKDKNTFIDFIINVLICQEIGGYIRGYKNNIKSCIVSILRLLSWNNIDPHTSSRIADKISHYYYIIFIGVIPLYIVSSLVSFLFVIYLGYCNHTLYSKEYTLYFGVILLLVYIIGIIILFLCIAMKVYNIVLLVWNVCPPCITTKSLHVPIKNDPKLQEILWKSIQWKYKYENNKPIISSILYHILGEPYKIIFLYLPSTYIQDTHVDR